MIAHTQYFQTPPEQIEEVLRPPTKRTFDTRMNRRLRQILKSAEIAKGLGTTQNPGSLHKRLCETPPCT